MESEDILVKSSLVQIELQFRVVLKTFGESFELRHFNLK